MTDLSTKWWNVIRRKMNATAAVEDPSAKCPDCGSFMHLMRGKFGRFYKCERFDCRGTLGAQLDGKAREPKGPAALLDARRRARDAVHLVVVERDRIARERRTEWKALGRVGWWNEPHELACCKDEFRDITFKANLDPIRTRKDRRLFLAPWEPVGLYLRKRNVEECERVVEAADYVLRRLRRNAWDQVLVAPLDELESEPTEAPALAL